MARTWAKFSGFTEDEGGVGAPHLPHHDTLGCLRSPPQSESQPYQSSPQLAASSSSASTIRVAFGTVNMASSLLAFFTVMDNQDGIIVRGT